MLSDPATYSQQLIMVDEQGEDAGGKLEWKYRGANNKQAQKN